MEPPKSSCTPARAAISAKSSRKPSPNCNAAAASPGETSTSTTDDQLRRQFTDEVPVVFIDGRKAFKYRMDEREFLRKLAS